MNQTESKPDMTAKEAIAWHLKPKPDMTIEEALAALKKHFGDGYRAVQVDYSRHQESLNPNLEVRYKLYHASVSWMHSDYKTLAEAIESVVGNGKAFRKQAESLRRQALELEQRADDLDAVTATEESPAQTLKAELPASAAA